MKHSPKLQIEKRSIHQTISLAQKSVEIGLPTMTLQFSKELIGHSNRHPNPRVKSLAFKFYNKASKAVKHG